MKVLRYLITLSQMILLTNSVLYQYNWKPLPSYDVQHDPDTPLIIVIKGTCTQNLRTKLYLSGVVDLEFFNAKGIDICCKGSTPNNYYNCRRDKQLWIVPQCNEEQLFNVTFSNIKLQIYIDGTQVLDYKYSSKDGKCRNTMPANIKTPSWSSQHMIAIREEAPLGLYLKNVEHV